MSKWGFNPDGPGGGFAIKKAKTHLRINDFDQCEEF